MIEAKALIMFIRVYSLFKNERLSANSNTPPPHKAQIRSVMAYSYLTWEFAVVSHLLKLQLLRDKVLRIAGKFPRRAPTRDLHVAFKIPCVFRWYKVMQAASTSPTMS